jgi:DNA-binding HxlR family transcriptional regulator
VPEPQQPHAALELVGHRWLLEILRAVANGPQRHRDLLGKLGGTGDPVYPKTLGATLTHLASHGLIACDVVRRTPRVVVYRSTPLGMELLELLEALERFVDEHRAELDPGARREPRC